MQPARDTKHSFYSQQPFISDSPTNNTWSSTTETTIAPPLTQSITTNSSNTNNTSNTNNYTTTTTTNPSSFDLLMQISTPLDPIQPTSSTTTPVVKSALDLLQSVSTSVSTSRVSTSRLQSRTKLKGAINKVRGAIRISKSMTFAGKIKAGAIAEQEAEAPYVPAPPSETDEDEDEEVAEEVAEEVEEEGEEEGEDDDGYQSFPSDDDFDQIQIPPPPAETDDDESNDEIEETNNETNNQSNNQSNNQPNNESETELTERQQQLLRMTRTPVTQTTSLWQPPPLPTSTVPFTSIPTTSNTSNTSNTYETIPHQSNPFIFSPARPRTYSKLMRVGVTPGQQRHQHESSPLQQSPPLALGYQYTNPNSPSPSKMLVNMDTNVQSVLEHSLSIIGIDGATQPEKTFVQTEKEKQIDIETEQKKKTNNTDLFQEQIQSLEEANVDLQQQLEWCEDEMQAKDRQIESLEQNGGGNENDNSTFDVIVKRLQMGGIFIKHGKRGSPHPRVVWIDASLNYICWRKPGTTSDIQKTIRIQDIVEIKKGQHTKRFQRNKGRDNRDHSSFSVITVDPERTLDLEVDIGPQPNDTLHGQFEREQRDKWVDAFDTLITWHKDQRMEQKEQGNMAQVPGFERF